MASDGFVLKTKKNDAPPKIPTTNANIPSGENNMASSKWTKERIWTEAVEREQKSVKEWEDKWHFLAEYDQRGNLKEPKKLPDRVNMFSENLPSSCGHQYGFRLNTDEGKGIVSIEKALCKTYGKRRNKDLICYD